MVNKKWAWQGKGQCVKVWTGRGGAPDNWGYTNTGEAGFGMRRELVGSVCREPLTAKKRGTGCYVGRGGTGTVLKWRDTTFDSPRVVRTGFGAEHGHRRPQAQSTQWGKRSGCTGNTRRGKRPWIMHTKRGGGPRVRGKLAGGDPWERKDPCPKISNAGE